MPGLAQLSRDAILRAVPLEKLQQAKHCLPLPKLLCQQTCDLKLSDFIINPCHVTTENIHRDIYPATVRFSGQRVQLVIIKNPESSEKIENQEDNNDLLTQFVDSGVLVFVYKAYIALTDVIQCHARIGKRIPSNLIWRVVKAITGFMLENEHELFLKLSDIKIDKDEVFISKSSETLSYFENNSNETMFTYSLTVSGVCHVIREMLAVNQRIESAHHASLNRLLPRRSQPCVADKNTNSEKEDLQFTSLVRFCLNQTNLSKSKYALRKILNMARMELGEKPSFPETL